MNKHKLVCPACEHQVEVDAVHSGGVILWRCCNCHHLMTNEEMQTRKDEYSKEVKNAAATAY